MHNPCFPRYFTAAFVGAVLMSQANLGQAANTLSVEATADTFLTNDSRYANSNMSSFGAMMISAPVQNLAQGISEFRTMENLVAYNSAPIKAGFDSQYGIGNWHVTDVRLKWYSNFDIPGVPANNNQFNVPATGFFNIYYFGNDQWFNPATAGPSGLTNPDLTWNSVYAGGAYSGLFANQVLTGTFYYPGGTYNGTTDCASVPDSCAPRFWDIDLTSDLLNDIAGGGYLSFHGAAADHQVVYLINQLTKPGAHPQIFVTAEAGAAPVPMPAAVWLLGSALAGLGIIARPGRQPAASGGSADHGRNG